MTRCARIPIVMLALLGLAATNRTQKIVIKGSNTFGEELGPRLVEIYRITHPDIVFELESKGTATGFAALPAGECDIAAAARAATEDELRLARSRGITLQHYLVGYYGVAIIVNGSNLVRALTDAQVADIFAGTITNWKQLGGDDAPIQTYIRDPSSGTYLGFQELAMRQRTYLTTAKKLKSYHEIANAVAADRSGIGYVAISLILPSQAQPMRINHEWPTATSVNDGVYPYARELRFYVNRDKGTPAAVEFVQFVKSTAGQQTIGQAGFIRAIEVPVWPPAPQ